MTKMLHDLDRCAPEFLLYKFAPRIVSYPQRRIPQPQQRWAHHVLNVHVLCATAP